MQASIKISQPWRPLLNALGKSLAGLALATSIIGYGVSGLPSLEGSTSAAIASTLSRQIQQSLHSSIDELSIDNLSIDEPSMIHEPSMVQTLQENLGSSTSTVPHFLPDGTYLYGQSAEAEAVGSVYMVFDVAGTDVTGALYVPNSSFDCFQGTIGSDELSLTIRDSYEQEVFPYAIALVANDDAIASSDSAIVTPSLSLDGFYPIANISDNDERILNTCRAVTW